MRLFLFCWLLVSISCTRPGEPASLQGIEESGGESGAEEPEAEASEGDERTVRLADTRSSMKRRRNTSRSGSKKGSGGQRRESVSIEPGKRMPVEVVHVIDADTVIVETKEKTPRTLRIRLAGINAPECHKERSRTTRGRTSSSCVKDDEAHGHAAFVYLKKAIHKKMVEIDCPREKGSSLCEMDHFSRLLGTIWLNGEDINRKLVAEGMAMAFTKYPHAERASYCQAEFEARKARKGLWSLAGDVPGVLSLMSAQTRKWYKKHDELCHAAIRNAAARKTDSSP